MFITNVDDREKLESIVVAQLKSLGIKYEKGKKPKTVWDDSKYMKKRIFHCHLDLLQLTDVIIANEEVVQIPQFLADAGEQILQKADTEGIFRKTGSIFRQKAIIRKLDAGVPLGTDNDIIDVANIFKTFFRQLHIPLIPNKMQETLIRSLLIGDKKINSILMSCLLMPLSTINILAYLMQLLNKIALKIVQNKMSIENLAIIFTPGIMPLTDMSGKRFTNHIKVIQILIQNANDIGIVPAEIISKLQASKTHPFVDNYNNNNRTEKPRSNSITRMLNGIKKIVNSTKSSNGNLLSTSSTTVIPCIRDDGGAIKRKMPNEVAFDSKKRKEIISSMPGAYGLLPNTQHTKGTPFKKRRTNSNRTPVKTPKPDKKDIQKLSPLPITLPFNFSNVNIADQQISEPEKEIPKTLTPKVTTTTTQSNGVVKQDSETKTKMETATPTKVKVSNKKMQGKSASKTNPTTSTRRSLKVNNLQCHYRAHRRSGNASTSPLATNPHS